MWFLQPGLTPMDIVMRTLAFLTIIIFILPLHEYAHAWVAFKLGDNTAKYRGRLTLNPMAHFDPVGAIFLFIFNVGWANPVPINPRNFKNPKRDSAITALAGPVSNILAALAGGIILNILVLFIFPNAGSSLKWVYRFFLYYVTMNVSLAVFNLIPIRPLDGSRILEAFISDRTLYKYSRYFNIATSVLFILILLGFLNRPLSIIGGAVYDFVMKISGAPFIMFSPYE